MKITDKMESMHPIATDTLKINFSLQQIFSSFLSQFIKRKILPVFNNTLSVVYVFVKIKSKD